MARRKLGESTTRDLDRSMRTSIFECGRMETPGERKACVQGVFDFTAFARRQFEGIFQTGAQVNRSYNSAVRLCRRRFKKNLILVDACDIGAWNTAMSIKRNASLGGKR